MNIRITGGQYPDAFMGVGFSNYDLARYGDDGTFLDLTPYLTLDIMPNLCAILEEHPEIRAAITQEDGKIYGAVTKDKVIVKNEDTTAEFTATTIDMKSTDMNITLDGNMTVKTGGKIYLN